MKGAIRTNAEQRRVFSLDFKAIRGGRRSVSAVWAEVSPPPPPPAGRLSISAETRYACNE